MNKIKVRIASELALIEYGFLHVNFENFNGPHHNTHPEFTLLCLILPVVGDRRILHLRFY